MPQTQQASAAPRFVPAAKTLPEQIAEAVENRATPLSQLLRLMSALESEGGNEALRLQLRARIGAPLDA
jgi:c-di-GMP-related signal transduction protein